jgi:hypothetical protein
VGIAKKNKRFLHEPLLMRVRAGFGNHPGDTDHKHKIYFAIQQIMNGVILLLPEKKY